jgi:hypothetical protein
LRNISEFNEGKRKIEECIPNNLEVGKTYDFLKKEQRLYWFNGEIPLIETKGNENLSKPKASIIIIEATHFVDNKEVYTKGKYKVTEVFNDDKIHFESYSKLNN